MNRFFRYIFFSLAGCALIALLGLHLRAADFGGPSRREHAVTRRNLLPFAGRINAIDRQTGSLTVGERVFQTTPKTKLTRANQPVTLDSVKVGDLVQGTYGNTTDGKLVAETLRFTAKVAKSAPASPATPPPPAAKAKKPAKTT